MTSAAFRELALVRGAHDLARFRGRFDDLHELQVALVDVAVGERAFAQPRRADPSHSPSPIMIVGTWRIVCVWISVSTSNSSSSVP